MGVQGSRRSEGRRGRWLRRRRFAGAGARPAGGGTPHRTCCATCLTSLLTALSQSGRLGSTAAAKQAQAASSRSRWRVARMDGALIGFKSIYRMLRNPIWGREARDEATGVACPMLAPTSEPSGSLARCAIEFPSTKERRDHCNRLCSERAVPAARPASRSSSSMAQTRCSASHMGAMQTAGRKPVALASRPCQPLAKRPWRGAGQPGQRCKSLEQGGCAEKAGSMTGLLAPPPLPPPPAACRPPPAAYMLSPLCHPPKQSSSALLASPATTPTPTTPLRQSGMLLRAAMATRLPPL